MLESGFIEPRKARLPVLVPRSCKTPLTTSTPQLPFKRPQIQSNRYHKALNRGTLGGLGKEASSKHGLSHDIMYAACLNSISCMQHALIQGFRKIREVAVKQAPYIIPIKISTESQYTLIKGSWKIWVCAAELQTWSGRPGCTILHLVTHLCRSASALRAVPGG